MRSVTSATFRVIRPVLSRKFPSQRFPFTVHQSPTFTSLTRQYPVHIRQPRANWRRISLWAFYATVSWFATEHLLQKLVDGLGNEENELEDEADEENEEDPDPLNQGRPLGLADDDDAFFLSLQSPKQLPRRNYGAWDPEWQEFVKLSRNPKRQGTIRRDLAEKLAQTASTVDAYQKRLGQNIKWAKLWLDFNFPDETAPEYVRHGVAFLDNGSFWSKQVIPHSHYVQMQHVLWPKALFTAASTAFQTLYRLQILRLKDASGIELQEGERYLRTIHERITETRTAQAMAAQSDSKTEEKSSRTLREFFLPLKQGDGDGSSFQSSRKSTILQAMLIDFSLSRMAFISALALAWKQSKLDTMPAGCCFVWGDVELMGSQGRCKLDVQAAYQPKTGSFVWIASTPRAFWKHAQKAKR